MTRALLVAALAVAPLVVQAQEPVDTARLGPIVVTAAMRSGRTVHCSKVPLSPKADTAPLTCVDRSWSGPAAPPSARR